MALGFIKKIFSFGKDEKVAPEPERVEALPETTPEVEPSAAPTSEALLQEAEEANPDIRIEDGETPVIIDPLLIEQIGDRLIIPDDLEHFRNDQVAELREQAESVAEFEEAVEEEPAEVDALLVEAAEAVPLAGEVAADEAPEPAAEAPLVVEPDVAAEAETTVEPELSDDAAGVSHETVAELPSVSDEETRDFAEPEDGASTAADAAVQPLAEYEPVIEAVPEARPEPEPVVEPVVTAESTGEFDAEVESETGVTASSEPEPLVETADVTDVVAESDVVPEPADEPPAAEEVPQLAAEPRAAPVLPAGFASAADRIEPAPVAPERKLSWIERLRQGLSRTSAQLTSQITSLFTKRKLDDDTLQELEDLLIQADLGVETALRITDTLASERYGKDVTGEDVSKIMASEITKVLGPVAKPLELDLNHKPHVILVVGVNGTGKTTTIGKLAAKLTRGGLRVMVAAGDTFRAAAIEQLHIWAGRTGADIVSSKLGADAAGLAYEAYEKAREAGHDVLIIDTAGRLQNKTELMAELEKIVRVLGRLDPDAPHTVLQTLDATTGQNALSQVEIFRNIAGVSGLIMTKLDGTARGGILVAISAKHKLPVYFIGVGEGVDDLEPFNARDFAEAIAGIQNK